MPLNSFFAINLPYLITKNKDGGWCALNREYVPLGFNVKLNPGISGITEYPIHTVYKNIRKATILKLAGKNGEGIRWDENGDIFTVYLYNDETNPKLHDKPDLWKKYFDKLQILSKFERKL